MRKYLPDFIVRVDDGHGDDDLLNLVVEIKGYRREDAKEKKSTMDTYWVPGVNHLGTLWPLGICRVHRGLSDRSGFQGQGRKRVQQDDRVRHGASGDREQITMAKKHRSPKDRRSPQARRGQAEEHPNGGISVRPAEGRAEPRYVWPTTAATRDLDPQLVWRGKDEQDWSDLVVHAPPLYIQEKVQPKALIDDLLRETKRARARRRADHRQISSPTSTASPRAWTRPSSISTTRTGRTA